MVDEVAMEQVFLKVGLLRFSHLCYSTSVPCSFIHSYRRCV